MIDLLHPLEADADEPALRAERVHRGFRIRVLVRWPRARALWLLPAGSIVLLLVAVAVAGTGYGYAPLEPSDFEVATPASGDFTLAGARAEQRRLEGRLRAAAPRGIYIVVDRTNNRLRLMRDGRVELDATCSAGSGSILTDTQGGRTWVFDTPRGEFRVRQKTRNPVWRKPDWAFIEEGEPIPTDPGERIEYGTLGEYALYLGDGYLIHGTLYERLLGRNVTHGCIRLGREDLRRVNAMAPVGTKVFIY